MAFVAIACLCCFVSFTGWVADVPALRDYGGDRPPVWPQTTLGYFVLSAGFLCAMRGQVRAARILWALPLGLGLISFFQTVTGLELGTDRLLFPDMIARYAIPHPGRPTAAVTIIFVLVPIAAYLSGKGNWRTDRGLGSLAGSAMMSIGTTAALLVYLGLSIDPATHSFKGSLPGSLTAISLAAAFIAWHGDFAWLRQLVSVRPDWRTVWLLLPTALLIPLAPALLNSWIEQIATLSPFASSILMTASNALIVVLLLYAAVTMVERSRAAASETAAALETTTVVLTDPDGRITYWSSGCQSLYGWTAAEAVGQYKYALLQSYCGRLESPIMPPRGPENEQELVEVRKDGTEIGVIERFQHVEIAGRGPVTVLKILDITERLRANAALRESQERLALAIASHEVGVFEWDVASGALHWSPGAEQRLGLLPGTMTDFESWRAQVEPEDVDNILDSIAKATAVHADKFSFRYRLLNPNSGIRAVEGSSRCFYDAQGNLERTVGVMVDTTERDEREAALRDREAQLRSVLETVPDAMVVIDGDGTICEFSTAAEALWGYRAEEVMGRHFTLLVPEELRERYAAAIVNYLERGEGGFLNEVVPGTGEAADGRLFPVEIRTGLARIGDKALFTIFFRDITDRHAAEERFSNMNAELAHVSRQSAMSELAADLAHELNQPLSATSNFLAAARMLIEAGEDSERALELLRMGSEQTLRAGQIIRRLRDFMERRDVEMGMESVEATVRDAVELVLVGTGQFHIRVAYAFDPEAAEVFADRIQLQQVLVNLLRNAMDALRASPPSRRQITVGSRPVSGQMVEINISDTGPGIPEAILKQLFSRFTTTKGHGGGMGIGLSISRRIVEAHGGTLTAENRPGGGAIFRFTLPAAGEGVEE